MRGGESGDGEGRELLPGIEEPSEVIEEQLRPIRARSGRLGEE